jgi:protein TonB
VLSAFAIERGEVLRWSGCFAAVVAAHCLLAWAVLSPRDLSTPSGGAPIVVELESLPVAPQQEPSKSVAGPLQMQTDGTPEVTPDVVREVEPTKVAKTEVMPELKERPIEEDDPVKPTEALEKEEPNKVSQAAPVETLPTPIEPKPLHPPEEKPPLESFEELPVMHESEVALSIPLPPPPPPEVEKKREELKAARQKVVKRKRPPVTRSASATTAPSAADQRAQRAVARHFSMDRNASMPSWRSSIVAHLQRHKRYPSSAQASGDTGTAYLSFTMDRAGRVISSRLVRGSGVSSLDQETLSLIRRAAPLPAAPPDVVGVRFTFTVPIRFSFR